jgi:hypothetical protein
VKLRKQSADLECLSKLVVLLVTIKFNLSDLERKQLESHLCPELRDGLEQVILNKIILFYTIIFIINKIILYFY